MSPKTLFVDGGKRPTRRPQVEPELSPFQAAEGVFRHLPCRYEDGSGGFFALDKIPLGGILQNKGIASLKIIGKGRRTLTTPPKGELR